MSAGGSASVGRAPGHASVIIPQAHRGLFSLATAAFATFQGEGKCMLGLVSPGLTEPGHHHVASFYWPKQVTRPVQLQKLEEQTPPPDGSSCTQCKGMHAGRAGEGSPPSTVDPLVRTATSRVRALP